VKCENCGKSILINKAFPRVSRKYQTWMDHNKEAQRRKEAAYCWRCWKIAIEIFKEIRQETPKLLKDSQFV